MNQVIRHSISAIAILLLLCIPVIVGAASGPDYTVTYTITIKEDGTALWHIEYRTLLATEEDLNTFENYSRDFTTIHLP